jgi:hypothetical protein
VYVRLGQRVRTGRLILWCLAALACGQPEPAHPVTVNLELDPAAPVAGRGTRALVTLRTSDGNAIRGATLQLEAHMSHPGMAPVVATFSETKDGVYAAPVDFTMAGDWVLVASATLPDGRRVTQTQRVDVKTVQ